MELVMNRIYLSRRNLEILLSKLNRQLNGEITACTIIKLKNKEDPPQYQQTMNEIAVTAVENDMLYTNRNPGAMLAVDEPVLVKTKIAFLPAANDPAT